MLVLFSLNAVSWTWSDMFGVGEVEDLGTAESDWILIWMLSNCKHTEDSSACQQRRNVYRTGARVIPRRPVSIYTEAVEKT